MSTVYRQRDWIARTANHTVLARPFGDDGCGDDVPLGSTPMDGYGYCTGTSMAAPLVSGIVALIRSTNPLLSAAAVRQILTASSALPPACAVGTGKGEVTCPATEWGAGIPNAESAVRAALGRSGGQPLVNRLTPLFGFQLYDSAWGVESTHTDYFYTVVPQMAASLLLSDSGMVPLSVGAPAHGYTSFPGASGRTPRASLYVFTTHVSPSVGGPALVPLQRLAYFAGTTPPTLDHTCVTVPADRQMFESQGYLFEGIEGYIYAPCVPEASCIPAGAVRVYRAYHPGRVDSALFPEAELSAMEAQGYTADLELLGYAYPNVDSDGDTLVNGFETLAGTNPFLGDTDRDGATDGQELLVYPYRDLRLVGSLAPAGQ